MIVLADDDSILGSLMSDSTREMVTEKTKEVLVVVYCFENDIDLNGLLEKSKAAFEKYSNAE